MHLAHPIFPCNGCCLMAFQSKVTNSKGSKIKKQCPVLVPSNWDAQMPNHLGLLSECASHRNIWLHGQCSCLKSGRMYRISCYFCFDVARCDDRCMMKVELDKNASGNPPMVTDSYLWLQTGNYSWGIQYRLCWKNRQGRCSCRIDYGFYNYGQVKYAKMNVLQRERQLPCTHILLA